MSIPSILFAPTPEAVWPVSVSGWVALVTGVTSLLVVLVGGAVAYGKWLGVIDGFGKRVADVEAALDKMTGADVERVRQLDTITHDHRTLIEKIGQAVKATDNCREENDQHALVLGSRMADLERKTTDFQLRISQRMARVETKAKLSPADFDNGE